MTETPPPAPPPSPEFPLRLLRYLPFITVAHFLIGLPALIASLALAYFAFVQADATQKMQTGGVMPFVTLGTSNVDDEGKADISLSMTNNGVGPAIMGPVEIRYRGKAIASPSELLQSCCSGDAKRLSFATSPATGVAIRPGEQLRFIGLPRTTENEAAWAAFNRERWKLKIRACYCSIYGDCWVTEGMQAVPRTVKACPTDWTPYREDAARRLGG
ncbi:hypothetical protein BWQ93_12645 [Sphingopyxis sp. QXT-31]|uniref:hypothetical protein n=1 Tax=Sphingopyxis sp. QXT-31 TaxID=1357916 RepID=UPI000979681A|nr:hypothetical protein [Sphingopyxis sp. QXT-31]APZ99242.1 hypothetical protein BWQ93_12645 [Sphingopyxis sp. QXT-31]